MKNYRLQHGCHDCAHAQHVHLVNWDKGDEGDLLVCTLECEALVNVVQVAYPYRTDAERWLNKLADERSVREGGICDGFAELADR